jgi:D-alanyl-D-alanine carboxypeptidase (penicillin-binding protein 5/6)
MTCILALDLGKKYSIDLSKELVTIGIFEQNIGGTSAKIQKGEIYSIEQLLYGLMLPSGNDASLAIAVWGGKLLLQK